MVAARPAELHPVTIVPFKDVSFSIQHTRQEHDSLVCLLKYLFDDAEDALHLRMAYLENLKFLSRIGIVQKEGDEVADPLEFLKEHIDLAKAENNAPLTEVERLGR